MRILLFALVALVLLATFAPPRLHRRDPPPANPTLIFERVPLFERDRNRVKLGRLVYLGGWALESNDARFGGISAMHVEGAEITALSDAGTLIRFPVSGSWLEGGFEIMDLPSGPGSPGVKQDRDVEALVAYGGHVWLALERRNEIWRYRRGWQSDAAAAPEAMREWPGNGGPEAMLRLPGGRFLLFAEGEGALSDVLLFRGDPALPGTETLRLRYRPPRGYSITDAALLPDGRLVFLNRRFSLFEGMRAKLTLGALPELVEDALLEGEEIADLRSPATVDNMEAMSVTREGGRTIVWLASDDNFNPLQRTLLLKFAFTG
jgi:hypothetical protein